MVVSNGGELEAQVLSIIRVQHEIAGVETRLDEQLYLIYYGPIPSREVFTNLSSVAETTEEVQPVISWLRDAVYDQTVSILRDPIQ